MASSLQAEEEGSGQEGWGRRLRTRRLSYQSIVLDKNGSSTDNGSSNRIPRLQGGFVCVHTQYHLQNISLEWALTILTEGMARIVRKSTLQLPYRWEVWRLCHTHLQDGIMFHHFLQQAMLPAAQTTVAAIQDFKLHTDIHRGQTNLVAKTKNPYPRNRAMNRARHRPK